MTTPVEREALFGRLTLAFGRQDNDEILTAMRPGVAIEVPGESPLAGHHRGSEDVHDFLVGLQRVFVPTDKPFEFAHNGNEMVMSQVLRAGTTEWTHRYRITFDEAGRVERILFEPDDIEAFDVLVKRVFETDDGPAG
jgi:hypothetical protein